MLVKLNEVMKSAKTGRSAVGFFNRCLFAAAVAVAVGLEAKTAVAEGALTSGSDSPVGYHMTSRFGINSRTLDGSGNVSLACWTKMTGTGSGSFFNAGCSGGSIPGFDYQVFPSESSDALWYNPGTAEPKLVVSDILDRMLYVNVKLFPVGEGFAAGKELISMNATKLD